MESIGVWDTVVNTRCQPVKQMQVRINANRMIFQFQIVRSFVQVWDACSDAIITLNHDNFSDDMAYIVENDLLMSALLQQLERNSNVALKSSASISSVQLPKDGCDRSGVALKTGERYSCDLLVSSILIFLFSKRGYVQELKFSLSSSSGRAHSLLTYCFHLLLLCGLCELQLLT